MSDSLSPSLEKYTQSILYWASTLFFCSFNVFVLWASACYIVCHSGKLIWSIEFFWALDGIRAEKWSYLGLLKFWDGKYFSSGGKGKSENGSQESVHSSDHVQTFASGTTWILPPGFFRFMCVFTLLLNTEAGRWNRLTQLPNWWRKRNPQVASTSTLWCKMISITWLSIRTIFTRYCRRMSLLVCSVTIRQKSMG